MGAVDLSADDAERPPPDWAQMLRRGMVRRCPRCGSGKLFRTWWSIKDRCPRCGLRFVREEGYFTGVYLVNYSFVAVAIVIELMAYLFYANANEGVSPWPAMLVGAATAIVLPVITYPFAKTLWTAIDLITRPLDPVEEADAALHDTRGDE